MDRDLPFRHCGAERNAVVRIEGAQLHTGADDGSAGCFPRRLDARLRSRSDHDLTARSGVGACGAVRVTPAQACSRSSCPKMRSKGSFALLTRYWSAPSCVGSLASILYGPPAFRSGLVLRRRTIDPI